MPHSVRARFLQALVCAGGMLVLPAPVLASGNSPVHVDPASPVAKEYALPLTTARGAPPESGQSGRLFGSGIRHTSAAPPSTTTSVRPTPATTVAAPPPAGPPVQQPVTTTAAATVTTRPPPRHRPMHATTVTLPSLTTPAVRRQLTAQATPTAFRVLRPGSGSGLLWMILAAVVVIALGSAGGIALRRR